MKSILAFVLLIFAALNSFSQTKGQLSFTENKGQVYNQNYEPQPGVLFSGNASGLTFHIKNNGVSYQLNRVDEYKEIERLGKEIPEREIAKQTIYRVDINWLNTNPNSIQITEGQLPGYNNYYLSACPNGALTVKSYKGVIFNKIYNNIDLHYYEKEGQLKYDYIVAPHANYKLIQLEITGAKIIKKENGSLLLKTPLGDIEEGAPLVYQKGRQLKAKWIIKNNILSFDIENYDPNFQLIIDPVARIWGTYYGGSSDERGQGSRTDASGNVYITGHTGSTTNMATTGAQQVTIGGGPDAFLAKFNSSGVRQWGTYYGANNNDYGESCCIDVSGNVYMSGFTNSNNNISTVGAHQTAFGGGTYDALFVKFNSSGLRQWATYYGATGDERGFSICCDNSGNIYLAGSASSTINIATPGTHQTTYGGGVADGYVAKFNSSGVRQWGTYYGGSLVEQANECCVDASGNVYLAGFTGSLNNISSTGAHQTTLGGNWDAFLVQFNSSGIRQWGTFYGGSAYDTGYSCSTDASGNVYLAGNTGSSNNISTTGAHQLNYGGGVSDAFIIQFDGGGTRQWGTYYGGATDDQVLSCACDATGNVYLAGWTKSTNNISSAGAHQFFYGGGTWDAFLARFNSSGSRIWGTYYGGNIEDHAESCSVDPSGDVYLFGWTNSPNNISTPGAHQTTVSPVSYDAFLVKFRNCPVDYNLATSVNNSLCVGSLLSFTTTVTTTATLNYNWSGPNSFTSFVQNPIITNVQLINSGNYIITADDGTGCKETINYSVTINPLPIVTASVSNTFICSGSPATLTAGGANTYTWNTSSTSSTTIESPTVNTSYTVTGTDVNGCENSAATSVTINPLPIVTAAITNTIICAGNTVTLTAGGANTYTWSTSSTGSTTIDSPTVNTSYTVTGSDGNGCENTASTNILINPLPNISITTSDSVICGLPFQGTATLTASGASSYTWSTSETGPGIAVSPSVNTVYTLTGMDTNGCENTAMITLSVNACIGIKDIDPILMGVKVYPNPVSNTLFISNALDNFENSEIEIINSLGQIALKQEYHKEINVSDLAIGCYAIKITGTAMIFYSKFIKE